jgi:hypothetical protein
MDVYYVDIEFYGRNQEHLKNLLDTYNFLQTIDVMKYVKIIKFDKRPDNTPYYFIPITKNNNHLTDGQINKLKKLNDKFDTAQDNDILWINMPHSISAFQEMESKIYNGINQEQANYLYNINIIVNILTQTDFYNLLRGI